MISVNKVEKQFPSATVYKWLILQWHIWKNVQLEWEISKWVKMILLRSAWKVSLQERDPSRNKKPNGIPLPDKMDPNYTIRRWVIHAWKADCSIWSLLLDSSTLLLGWWSPQQKTEWISFQVTHSAPIPNEGNRGTKISYHWTRWAPGMRERKEKQGEWLLIV